MDFNSQSIEAVLFLLMLVASFIYVDKTSENEPKHIKDYKSNELLIQKRIAYIESIFEQNKFGISSYYIPANIEHYISTGEGKWIRVKAIHEGTY